MNKFMEWIQAIGACALVLAIAAVIGLVLMNCWQAMQ